MVLTSHNPDSGECSIPFLDGALTPGLREVSVSRTMEVTMASQFGIALEVRNKKLTLSADISPLKILKGRSPKEYASSEATITFDNSKKHLSWIIKSYI